MVSRSCWILYKVKILPNCWYGGHQFAGR
ncbi:hypothetical protein D917_08116 [Trichinella nativa]|uniref:Uncharacterized protein n=1 Tax=Trichinella nativa TaxID=6335 RepID=A0A1Y3EL89_9BILA|nr:hypothetical protein D917_08116 [Trichinella nativa]